MNLIGKKPCGHTTFQILGTHHVSIKHRKDRQNSNRKTVPVLRIHMMTLPAAESAVCRRANYTRLAEPGTESGTQ